MVSVRLRANASGAPLLALTSFALRDVVDGGHVLDDLTVDLRRLPRPEYSDGQPTGPSTATASATTLTTVSAGVGAIRLGRRGSSPLPNLPHASTAGVGSIPSRKAASLNRCLGIRERESGFSSNESHLRPSATNDGKLRRHGSPSRVPSCSRSEGSLCIGPQIVAASPAPNGTPENGGFGYWRVTFPEAPEPSWRLAELVAVTFTV